MKNLHVKQEEFKQETIEEAAERFYPLSKGGSMWMPSADDCNKANKQEGFIQGAKWQEERMYSEEDMKKAFIEGHNVCRCVTDNTDEAKECFNNWFEQFKNKGGDK